MRDKIFSNRFFLFSVAFVFCVISFPFSATAGIEDHITRTESGFYYTVQKGDTLWDLSQKFADSPWVWPEMWRYNPQIKNPHLIYPGQKLLIYQKGWEGDKDEKQPEPEIVQRAEKIQTFHTFTEINRVGFIREDPVPHLGTIFKSLEDVKLINDRTLVYIYPEPGAPPLSVGKSYTTFRTSDPIRDEETNQYIGIHHLLSGIVEITAVEPEFAIARVVESYRDILVGDRIMERETRNIDIPIQESRQDMKGKIIYAEEDETLTAQYSIVFIDKGENDGIAPGQSYSIYMQETGRPEPEKFRTVALTPYRIGELIVLRTEKSTSTALITKSSHPVSPGHLVRTLEVAGN